MKFGKTFPNHQVPEWGHQYVNYKFLKKLIKQITRTQEKLYHQQHRNSDGENEPPTKTRDSTQRDDNYMDDPEVKKLLASFFFALDRDIEKVDNFHNMQYLEYERRLRRLTSSAQFTDITNALIVQSGIPLLSGLQHPQPQIGGLNPSYDGHQNTVTAPPIVAPSSHDISDAFDEVLGILVELRSHFRNLKWYGELNKRAFTKILKKLDKKVGTNQQAAYLQARILPLGFSNDTEVMRNLAIIKEFLDKVSYKAGSIKNPFSDKNDTECIDMKANTPNNFSSTNDVMSMLIEKDDGAALINELISVYRSVVLIQTRVLVNLLNKAALSQSFNCIDELLEIIPSLRDPTDINVRNFFHHHVIALGKNHYKMINSQNAVTELAAKAEDKDETDVNSKNKKYSQEVGNGNELNGLNSLLKKTLSFEAAAPPDRNLRLIGAFGPDGINSNDSPASLLYILNKLPAHLRPCVLQRDNYKRTPLHYSAQYGLVEVTKIIIENLKEWGAWDPDVPIDDAGTWGDCERLTPLHLAVLGSHPLTVRALLSYMNPSKAVNSPQLLHLATRLNSPPLIKALLSAKGFDINYHDEESHETPLYLACKLNLHDAALCLLENGANTEMGERLFGWTPIFAAATEGFKNIVQLLVNHGANYVVFDESGWSPMEHAALRGHLDITEMLKITNHPEITHPRISTNDIESINSSTSPVSVSVTPVKSNEPSNTNSGCISSKKMYNSDSQTSIEHLSSSNNSNSKVNQRELLKSSVGGNGLNTRSHFNSLPQPVKSFGHRYLDHDESLLLITLGGNDTRNTNPAVLLNNVPVSKVASTELDTALSLVISCNDDLSETPIVLDLPLDANLDSVTFKVPYNHDNQHVVYFDIVPTYGSVPMKATETNSFYSNGEVTNEIYHAGNTARGSQSSFSSNNNPGKNYTSSKVIGRAVALLNKTGASVGFNRRSLTDMATIPIVASETLDVLGTIEFEYIMVSPFHHPKMSLGRTETYWKSLVSTRVIGHRGLGKNLYSKKSLQLGENTVESFIAAASLGASYVEFDVQLTKDNIPVVYHDFLVAETGVDIPMHELTLEQFLDLNSVDNHVNGSHARERRRSVDDTDRGILKRSFGDNSNKGNAYSDISSVLENRMRLTKTYKKNNFKGNFRGHSIASSFVTLKELFKKIPANVGFNIECKYPMVDEAEKEDIGQIAVEMNHWVDTILEVVYDNANGRDIIFSSFHPDICAMLSLKQPSIPILFLTEGGTAKMADIRATSLQNAIRFARSWNLLGIVSAASPIIKAPRLAQVVKSSGLVCVTYGAENNDPENANIEMDAGVDAVIVDNVLAIRKGLTKDASDTKTQNKN